MMTLNRLAQFAANLQFERLLDEVMANGRRLPVSARMRLKEAGAIAPAALGMALRRAVELSYRPQPGAIALAAQLRGLQADDGSFGNPASTAIAAAGLLALADQAALWGGPALAGPASREAALRTGMDADELAALSRAAESALAFLGAQQRRTRAAEAGSAWAGLIVNPVDTALVLWQVGRDARFRAHVDFDALLDAIVASGLMHDPRCRPMLVASATVEAIPADSLFAGRASGGGADGGSARPWRSAASAGSAAAARWRSAPSDSAVARAS